MPTTVESLIIAAWLIVVCTVAVVMSSRLALWLQRSRGEQPTAVLHARYRMGIIIVAIGGFILVATVLPALLNIVPGGISIFVGLPIMFVLSFVARSKLVREKEESS